MLCHLRLRPFCLLPFGHNHAVQPLVWRPLSWPPAASLQKLVVSNLEHLDFQRAAALDHLLVTRGQSPTAINPLQGKLPMVSSSQPANLGAERRADPDDAPCGGSPCAPRPDGEGEFLGEGARRKVDGGV